MTDFTKDIELAIKTLKKGGIIVYPTDTIWGIGCDANNSKAIDKIFKIKQRHHSKSMIVLLDSVEKLKNYMVEVPEIAISLIEQVKTPLTIVYPNAKNISKNALGTDGSVAIRIVKESFCKELCRQFENPIISTSANISGYDNPFIYKDISPKLLSAVDYVVEYGRDQIKQINPSTIIKLKNQWEYEIIRA
jgi:L-threonylcarbamoyladenylate synthase